ncbi:MAG: PAS domain S-box protein, partial [Nitrospirota bacterium]
MNKRASRASEADPIRRRAEKDLKAKSAEKIAGKDLMQVIHELEVRKVELETQNDELKRIKHELEDSRKRYSELYDFAPVGFLTLDDMGTIIESNKAAAHLLDCSGTKLIGKRFHLFVALDYRRSFAEFLNSALVSGKKKSCETLILKSDDTTVDSLIEGKAGPGRDADKKHIRIAVVDISGRKRMQESL